MSFPLSAILDDGNRADENPLSQGGNWTSISELNGLKVVTNQFGCAVAAYDGSYRGSYADVEAFCTLGNVNSSDILITTRYQDAGGASPIRDSRRRGYQLNAGQVNYSLTRMDDGATGSLIIAATAWPGGNRANGDSFGLRSVNDMHEIWLKRSGGSWELVAWVIDSTYTNASAIAFQCASTSTRIDDLGGGVPEAVDSPFPTTPLLDDFNRADGSPGSNWTNALTGAAGPPQIEANRLKNFTADTSDSGMYWNTDRWADCEVWATVPVVPSPNTEQFNLNWRTLDAVSAGRNDPPTNSTNGWSGYRIIVIQSGIVRVQRYDGTTLTQIGSDIATACNAGDSFGAQHIGNSIKVFRKSSYAGSRWWQIGPTLTDSTYPEAGYLAIQMDEATARLDNFGGGAVGALAQNITPLRWR